MKFSHSVNLASLLLALSVSAVQADPLTFTNPFSAKPSSPNTGNPVYVGGSLGLSTADDFCNKSESCNESDLSWKVFAGYDINSSLSIEAGYNSLGTISSSTNVSEVSGLELAAVGKMPLNNQVGVFGKAGLFKWTADNNDGERSAIDIMYGIGADYKINDNVSIRGEWESFNDIETKSNQTSDIQMISAGVTYRTL